MIISQFHIPSKGGGGGGEQQQSGDIRRIDRKMHFKIYLICSAYSFVYFQWISPEACQSTYF